MDDKKINELLKLGLRQLTKKMLQKIHRGAIKHDPHLLVGSLDVVQRKRRC